MNRPPTSHPRRDLDAHLLHGVRMSLLALLVEADDVEFALARDALEVSDSVLSRQASALEKINYVRVRKGHVGKRPRTWLSATPAGRNALRRHLHALERIAGGAFS